MYLPYTVHVQFKYQLSILEDIGLNIQPTPQPTLVPVNHHRVLASLQLEVGG